MQAFHNDPAIKAKYVSRVKHHIIADDLHKGMTGDDGKGCAVWCTLDAYDHSRYPIELGIPEWLARVEDTLFEGMNNEKSRTWPLLFLETIQEGQDLEKIKPKFLIYILERVLKTFDHDKYPEVVKVVNGSIELWRRSGIGTEEWQTAAETAAEAAGAAWAAEAAARAAWAAEAAEAAGAAWAAESAWAAALAARAAETAEAAARAARAAWAAETAWAAALAAGTAACDEMADKLLEMIRESRSLTERQDLERTTLHEYLDVLLDTYPVDFETARSRLQRVFEAEVIKDSY